jgi:hypothetical protein
MTGSFIALIVVKILPHVTNSNCILSCSAFRRRGLTLQGSPHWIFNIEPYDTFLEYYDN